MFPGPCVTGAHFGLMLWFNTLLPTLFPFFLITQLIIVLNLCPEKLMTIYPFFVGLIAGYPTGALTCSEMNRQGYISNGKAQCMLIVCNNLSPIFLISYIACYCLNLTTHKYIIWLSVISASTITALLFYYLKYRNIDNSSYKSNFSYTSDLETKNMYSSGNHVIETINRHTTDNHANDSATFFLVFEQTMLKAFEMLVYIGGYVILFSMLATLMIQLPISESVAAFIAGLFEITTGSGLMHDCYTDIPINIKSAALATLCGFGGLSGIMQTKSVLSNSNLSITHYIFHKIICGIISGIICYILVLFLGILI